MVPSQYTSLLCGKEWFDFSPCIHCKWRDIIMYPRSLFKLTKMPVHQMKLAGCCKQDALRYPRDFMLYACLRDAYRTQLTTAKRIQILRACSYEFMQIQVNWFYIESHINNPRNDMAILKNKEVLAYLSLDLIYDLN
jgi:hypothetical protein